MCNEDKIAKNSFSNEQEIFFLLLHRCCRRVGVIRRNTNSNLISDQHRKELQAPVVMNGHTTIRNSLSRATEEENIFSSANTCDRSQMRRNSKRRYTTQLSDLFMLRASRLFFWFIYIVAKPTLAILARAMREIASVSVLLSADANRFEMKVCVVLVTIFLIAACDGQTHPMAWQREQRDQRVCR